MIATGLEEPTISPEFNNAFRPVFLRLSHSEERSQYRRLRERLPSCHIHDAMEAQLVDLVRVRHPERRLGREEAEADARALLGGCPVENYGVWIFYPWSQRLIHLLDESDFAELRTNRNQHKITAAEQLTLSRKRVGVVGLSVGQSVAITMALERGFGEIRLADFDHIDLSNLNRIRTGVHNLGVSKAVVAAREIAEIDPYLHVTCFPEGLQEGNMARFFEGGGQLDLLIEECDSFDMKVLVRYEARRRRIPVVMDTNDRGLLDIERFDLHPNLPIFHGRIGEPDAEQLRTLSSGQKVAFVLGIIGDSVSPRLAASFVEIESTIGTWPQLASSVSLGGALAADVSRRILLGLCKANGRFLVDLDAAIPNVRPEGPKDEVAATPPLDPQTMAAEAAAVEAEWPSGVKPSFDEVREVAAAGMMAPSAGNCQPWKFYWGGKGLHLFHDRSRSTGDFNYEAAQLALGAAWENCSLESRRLGWDVEAQVRADGCGSPLTVSFAFAVGRHEVDPLVQHIASRHTVRALTSRKPVEAAILQSLSEAGSRVPGADVTWLTSDDELLAAGELAGSADRIRFLDLELHRQLMTELRFRRDEVQATRDGIDVETLGLSCEDQAAMELLRSTEGMRYLREWNAGANLKKMSAKAIAAASAVGLLTMPAVPGAFLHAGRALQRIWLKATSLNMGLHPMAGLPFLLARLTRGNGLGLQESTRGDLRRILPVYQDLFRIEPGRVDVILFRLQCGIPKAPRSVRKPLEEMFITQPVT
jgi:hypothetical protein